MLYRLDDAINNALESAYDPETGELLTSEEELFKAVQGATEEFDELVDSVACSVKNYDSEAAAIAAEVKNLTERKRIAENKRDRAKRLLAWLLAGQKWQNGRHKIGYRKSETVVLDDEFMEWAEREAPGLLKIEMEPRKAEIKNALKNGVVFEHAHLEEKNNIQVR